MFAATPPHGRAAKAMSTWLLICAAMVFFMVILGGATRLTESGLSMVEWKPLTLLPPLTEADWAAEFTAYQASPEFVKVNSWMGVEDFKTIYWFEYTHRLWGRLIGFAFAIPFVVFLWRREVDQSYFWKFLGLLALGGAQGVLGWYMVASGLVDRPDVSHYRLAAHLITAFICFGLMLWVAFDLRVAAEPRGHQVPPAGFQPWAAAVSVFALVVVVSGAFVAGLNAGKGYNTFPLMDGAIIPDGLYATTPWWAAALEHHMTIQFNHRVLAITLVILIGVLWTKSRRIDPSARTRKLIDAMAAMAVVQAALGITTLLLVVPIGWALAHQTGAQILFALSVATWWSARPHLRTAHPSPTLSRPAHAT